MELATALGTAKSGGLIMAAIAQVFTISYVANLLGEDEDWLFELSTDMFPEDGCLWVYGVGEDGVPAFTKDGIENLRQIIADERAAGRAPAQSKRPNSPACGAHRMLTLGPEFDNFLFAPIGEDGNGMLLSVLSALARLDIDPWQEAAKLSGLPGAAATQRLASLIAALLNELSAHPDPATVAARLVALLPRPANPNIPSRAPPFGAGAVTHPQAIIYVYVIFMVFALGAQWIAANRLPWRRSVTFMHRPRAQFSAQVRPPISGQ